MKQYVKLIIIAIVLIVLTVGAVVLYNSLAEDYDPYANNDDVAVRDTSEPDDTAETAETEGVAETVDTSETDLPAEKIELQIDDATVYDMDGNAVNVSDFAGKPIIVNFWATWCGPCKSEMPDFQKMYEEYGDDVVFMMVNATDGARDTLAAVEEFISANGYTFTVYCDTELDAINTYGVYAFPSTLIINADGTLYDARVGAISETQLQSIINALLGIN